MEAPNPIAAADPAESSIATTLLELGTHPGLFQFPHSGAREIVAIAAEKRLHVQRSDAKALGEDYILSAVAPEGTDSWIARTSAGLKGVVIQDGDRVWVNVANLEEGYGGNQIYDLAANYAINNGLKFIGDPAGVTHAALRRRLEHMLSSAIKYGTTEHLIPHESQLDGDAEAGIAPLPWADGNTLGNIEAMVDASMATTAAAEPAANSITYDVHAHQFQAPDGSRLGAGDIARLLEQGGLRVPGHPGVTTLQRTALFRALLQGADARRAVLDSFRGQQGEGSASLGGLFY